MNPTFRMVTLTVLLLSTLIYQPSIAFAQGTAFTYQGRLNDGSNAANGSYDFTFTLFSIASGAGQVGNALTNSAVGVTNGLFTALLDFGANFPGANRWLEIAVRTNGGGAFTTLAPRQQLTPTPYAITASNLTGSLPATQLSGSLPSAQLAGTYTGAVTLNNPANSFTGNGTGLTNVNAATLGGLSSSNFWRTTGNPGTTAGTHFLGTTDNQPLEIKVNGLRALRLENNGDSSDSGTAPDGAPNVIGGSPHNFVGAGVVGATIAGGGATNYFGTAWTNSVLDNFGSVGGGIRNTAGSPTATIGGGDDNVIAANSPGATIAGGSDNNIGTNSDYSAIGGGGDNNIAANSIYATISGGRNNDIRTSSSYSAIGGGVINDITNSQYATIAGGASNEIGTNSDFSTIGGGDNGTIMADSPYATIPGGRDNTATNYAFAAGRRAKAIHTGAFVWADSQDADFASTDTNQFLIRAAGGVGINVTNPVDSLHVQSESSLRVRTTTTGTGFAGFLSENSLGEWFAGVANATNHWYLFENAPLSGARLVVKSGGNVGIGTVAPTNKLHVIGGVSATAFVTTSDRNAKENFTAVDAREVLDKVASLPITRWNYKAMRDGSHIGPMAQDFYAAFGLGGSETTITSIDPDGVALAAIQGLNQKTEDRSQRSEVRIQKLEAENAALKQRLEKLERLILNHQTKEN